MLRQVGPRVESVALEALILLKTHSTCQRWP